tara:strand:- start:19266 stop:20126 length:861 start_codon:yes stop_codon:yes gene_type:complete
VSCDEGRIQAYLDDSLPEHELTELEEHLEHCPQCQDTLQSLCALQEDVSLALSSVLYPMDAEPIETEHEHWTSFAQTLPSPTQETTWTQWFSLWFSGRQPYIFVAGFACLLIVGLYLPALIQPTTQPHNNWKGEHDIELFHMCRSPQGILRRCPTEQGASLPPRALIQFTYHARVGKTPLQTMILSINARGEIAPYVPFNQPHSLALTQAKGTLPVGQSLELDDYLGKELIVAIIAKKPFQLSQAKEILAKAYQQHAHSLQRMAIEKKGWSIQTWLIEKRPTSFKP